MWGLNWNNWNKQDKYLYPARTCAFAPGLKQGQVQVEFKYCCFNGCLHRAQRKIWDLGRDPFNQNSNRSDREKWSTSKSGPVFSKLSRLDRTDPLSFGPKFPQIVVEWIAPLNFSYILQLIARITFVHTRIEYSTLWYSLYFPEAPLAWSNLGPSFQN